MAKMRVHELAKELDIKSADIVKALGEKGIDVKAMSSVDDSEVKYIKDNYPFMYEKDYIYDTHNAYVGALVMSGAVGVILLLVFIVIGFLKTVKYFRTTEKPSLAIYLMLALIVIMLSASFFEADLFFRCTSTSVIFWISAGLLVKHTDIKTKA